MLTSNLCRDYAYKCIQTAGQFHRERNAKCFLTWRSNGPTLQLFEGSVGSSGFLIAACK